MNRLTIDGFIKRAQEAGLSTNDAVKLLKSAGIDPAQFGGDPSQQGGGMPPAGDPSQQAGDPAAAAGAGGIPPEIEQLISQLPPEALEQLVQEIQAEIANGGQGGDPSQQGGDPNAGAGGPPPMDPNGMPKQGSEKILAKEASYVEGFFERGISYGFNKQDVTEMYKKALAIMDPSSAAPQKAAKLSDKQASHFEGFIGRASQYGISDQEAVEVYRRTFNNK